MNKAELIEKMAKDAKVSKVAAAAALNSFMDGVTKALKKKDGKVTLVGFGTFSVAKRAASQGRNPRTGEAVRVARKFIPFFKTGKQLRERLNTG